MDEGAVQRAQDRIAEAAAGRPGSADVDAALERARAQLEAFATVAAELEATLPAQVGEAVREGLRREALPVARQLAEVRGLSERTVRGLERVEGELAAERYARVDDFGLLVDLVVSGWRSMDERLRLIEHAVQPNGSATVHHLGLRTGA